MTRATRDNTLCWFPFNQLAIKGWLKGIGPTAITPCCNMTRPNHTDPMNNSAEIVSARGNLTPEDVFYSAKFNELRQGMIRGEKHSACSVCWKMEEISDFSYRLNNSSAGENIDIDDPVIKSIDLGTGEHCNLRCRMCGPGNSNKLRADMKFFNEHKMTYMTTNNKMWHWDGKNTDTNAVLYFDEDTLFYKSMVSLKTLTKLKASGGEPLISASWKNWIDEVLKDKDYAAKIRVECHTNATKFTDENIKRLKQFRETYLICSVDATEKVYEYIRYPMTWSALNNSMNKYITAMSTEQAPSLNLNSVLSIYSAFDIFKFTNWCIDLHSKSNATTLNIHIDWVFPDAGNLDIRWLPNYLLIDIIELTKRSIDKIERLYNTNSNHMSILPKLMEYLNIDKPLKKQLEMKREIIAFDMSRSQHYADFLEPKLVSWLNTLDHTQLK